MVGAIGSRVENEPCRLLRCGLGDVRAAPGGKDANLSLFNECCAVATEAGFALRAAFLEFVNAFTETAGADVKASMLRDMERDSATEGEHVLGDLVERARALKVATPISELTRLHLAAYEIVRVRGQLSPT